MTPSVSRSPRRWIANASASMLFACGGSNDARPDTDFEVVDSLGVTIVTNHLAESPSGSWRVGNLITSIGAVEGDSTQILGSPVASRRLENGTIAVSDQMASHIRVYDTDGSYVSTHGRAGEGPGEFQYLGHLLPYRGDSIIAVELFGRRMSVLGPGLAFGRVLLTQPTFVFRSEGLMAEQSCCPVSGMLGGDIILEYPGMIPTTGLGARRSFVTIVRLSPTGAFLDTLGRFESMEYYPAGAGSRSPVRAAQLSSRVVSVAVDSTLYVTEGRTFEVKAFDTEGNLRQINRIARQPMVIDGEVQATYRTSINALLDEQLERSPESAAETESYRRSLDDAPFHETVPTINTMMVDRVGNLWVTALSHHWTGAANETWEVFNPFGRWLATVEIPSDLRIFEFGPDYVIALAQDELEVSFIHVYELLKSQPPAAR